MPKYFKNVFLFINSFVLTKYLIVRFHFATVTKQLFMSLKNSR